MNFYVMTLFPEMIQQAMATSITGRAIQAGYLHLETVNIRDFADNKHNRVDDYPYGGGAGMVMQAEPVFRCYQEIVSRIAGKSAEQVGIPEQIGILERPKISEQMEMPVQSETPGQSEIPEKLEVLEKTETPRKSRAPRVIYLTPQGSVFSQKMAEEYAKEDNLVFLCGHYEGIDERVLEEVVTDYVSIGDYVLTGGELPALVMMDTISRLVPGVLSNEDSAQTESFSDSLLEYPQYTRPRVWREKEVPSVLLSGHHKNLQKWYREQSVIRTARYRPDLLEKAELTEEERQLVERMCCESI